jgi:hypothetical protein
MVQTLLNPIGHLHWPVMHCANSGHWFPHVPQLLKSVLVSTHVPPQSIFPLGQEQAPPRQVWPSVHVLPHAPQLLKSLLVSTHVPPQSVLPLGQTHMPTTHWRPPVHSASLQQPSGAVHKLPVAKQHALPGQQFWPPGQFTPGAQVQQFARRFPLASNSTAHAIIAVKAPARIMPSLKEASAQSLYRPCSS